MSFPLPLCDFQSQIATVLIKGKQKLGRPSLEATSSSPPLGPQRPVHAPRPLADVSFDGVDHMPTWDDRQRGAKNMGVMSDHLSNVKSVRCICV